MAAAVKGWAAEAARGWEAAGAAAVGEAREEAGTGAAEAAAGVRWRLPAGPRRCCRAPSAPHGPCGRRTQRAACRSRGRCR